MSLRYVSLSSSAVLALSLLPCAFAPVLAAGLTITTHTASDNGFQVNSHLVAGEKEAILVDGQMLKSEAAKVVEMVKASGKTLTHIVVTHGHPDHFLGLEVLAKEFPKAKIVAPAAVIADMKVYGPKAIAGYKDMFKDDLPTAFPTPAALKGKSITLEKTKINVIAIDGTESPHAIALHIPSEKAFLAGDAVYSKVHLWTAEGRLDAWKKALKGFEKTYAGVEKVYPGHGPVGGPELFAWNVKYLEDFQAVLKASKTKAEAVEALKAKYPDTALPIIADIGFGAKLK